MSDNLQDIFRHYFKRVKAISDNLGLSDWYAKTLRSNKDGECTATREQVDMLGRLTDDYLAKRKDLPKITGKSFRQMIKNKDFYAIRKFKDNGLYSKIDAMAMKEKRNDKC